MFIDKEGGIDIEECAFVSEKLSDKLDSIDPDPIPQAYFQKYVFSRGRTSIEKEADYQKRWGQYINVSLYQNIDGEKQYQGFLKELTEDELTLTVIKTRTRTWSLIVKILRKARYAIEF